MAGNLRDMIKLHEGLRLKPYRCSAGRWTIGYGHNLDAHGETRPESITIEKAEKYLNEDLAAAEKQCRLNIPWFETLSEVRRAVLIDMCFNLGIKGLLGFKQTLNLIAIGKYTTAAIEMLDSKWSVQVGMRANRLAAMMAYDKWAEDIPV